HDISSFVSSKKYDFIQVSNITDWLETKENICQFVKKISSICSDKGKIIWRSLNGIYNLEQILKDENHTFHSLEDKSYFYKTCLVNSKKIEIMTFVQQLVDLSKIENHIYFKNLKSLDTFFTSQIPFFLC